MNPTNKLYKHKSSFATRKMPSRTSPGPSSVLLLLVIMSMFLCWLSPSYCWTTTTIKTISSSTTTTSSSSLLLRPHWDTSPAVRSSTRTLLSMTPPSSSQPPPASASSSSSAQQQDPDDEIERLKSMAAKLRADAAKLEAEKAQQLADAAEKAFRKFDTNQDGEITLEELKAGLEKAFKMDLSDKRVKELMKEFDESGDGRLQLDEFVGMDQFRNKLEALSREEKRLAAEAKKMAQKEAEVAKLLQAKMEILNDREPTVGDKVLSILPYLFPLMDGLQYGRFLLGAEGAESNPFVIAVAVLYALYRTIPFSGFIAFFVLNFLQGNPGLNRLIRYNMQQAIFIDIALFFPGLLSGLIGLMLGGANVQLPTIVTQISTDAIFVTLLAVLGYCTVSSLLGLEPNKVPIISQAVNDRMPTIDMFEIDAKGNIFANPNRRRNKQEQEGEEEEEEEMENKGKDDSKKDEK